MDRLELFRDRLIDYKATVARASGNEEISALVLRFLQEVKAATLVGPPALDKAWRTGTREAGIRILRDDPPLFKDVLNKTAAVVTAATVGIAETGTLVLDHRPDQGRRIISLLPDTHICVVGAEQIVTSVSEAVEQLASSVAAKRPMTWISGPSATVDIELTRVEGVHGPRNLYVIVSG